MTKKFYVLLLVIIIAVIAFFGYKYREQNLADLVKIKDVKKVYIIMGNKGPEEFQLIKPDDETIHDLSEFLGQYRVKLTNQEGWSSEHPNEQFTLYLGYIDGDLKIYTFERDIVAWSRGYKVLNPPLDYKAIEKLEQRLISE
ncbi:hypothetical protein [Neobacillus sp. YIM B06451]|uniref:hypothetical protein n=1 Tax=Neobacillus sp. YIM B06451 TaxID=3070994 RepID=UPI00293194D3|nr:hypothetical protein [Neobacillus sp. YIM B06451]